MGNDVSVPVPSEKKTENWPHKWTNYVLWCFWVCGDKCQVGESRDSRIHHLTEIESTSNQSYNRTFWSPRFKEYELEFKGHFFQLCRSYCIISGPNSFGQIIPEKKSTIRLILSLSDLILYLTYFIKKIIILLYK